MCVHSYRLVVRIHRERGNIIDQQIGVFQYCNCRTKQAYTLGPILSQNANIWADSGFCKEKLITLSVMFEVLDAHVQPYCLYGV